MMAPLPTMIWHWDAASTVMRPLNPARARREFTAGENYRLEIREERSEESHRHFFAAVNEAWENLPESLTDRFPSPDHLRRWCLVKAGYCDERTVVCETRAAAQRTAAWARQLDSYAVIVVRENVVIARTAKSQSIKSMGKAEFQRSKDAVLRELAALIGTAPAQLQANAGRAA